MRDKSGYRRHVSRRSFMQLGGIAAASMVVSGCTINLQQPVKMEPYVHPPEETLPGEDFWFASTCRMCPAGCGIITRVSNGRARKIEGNPEHPLNRGKLCARGQAGLQLLYHPDRLQQIQLRQGDRGRRQWQTATWDDALKQIVALLQGTDPGRVAFLTGVLPTMQVSAINRFLGGLGAPDAIVYDGQSAFDGRAALETASQDLFGEAALPVFNIAHADVVFGFGADFLETWLSPVAYNQAYGVMRNQNGIRGALIAFEPRMSLTGANADRWVPVPPGLEGQVAQAIGNIIVTEGAADIPEQFRSLYEGVDPAAIAGVAGLSIDDLTRLAHLFMEANHPVALPGSNLAGYSNSLDAIKAVLALNVITGDSGTMFLAPQPSRNFRTGAPNSFTDVQALIEQMSGGQIDVLFVLGANPVYELPETAGFSDALSHVGRVISLAVLPDETTDMSDIVLPLHSYLETWGFEFVNPSMDKNIVGAQQPVVQPLYDTRDSVDILMALANRLGGEVASRLPWPNLVNFMQTRLVSLQLEAGNITASDIDTFWADWLQHGGWWSQDSARSVPQLVADAGTALQVADPIFEGSADQYPFNLLPVPSIVFGDGRNAGLPWLQETPDPITTASWDTWIELNPETANRLGMQNDDLVTVRSPAGDLEAIVYIQPAIHPDVVAIPVGQGHTALGRWAQNRGANVLQILASQTAPDTGQWAWASTRVQLIKTRRKVFLPRLENTFGVEQARLKSLSGGE